MNNSLPLPLRKSPSRATLSKAAESKAEDPQFEAVLEEVRQLRAAIAVYRKIVDKLLEKKAA
jgi:hypothetical protein